MKKSFLVALSLAVGGIANGHSAETNAKTVLDANHVVVGDPPTVGAVLLEYNQTASGLTGPALTRYDLATGSYVESQDADGIHTSDGFDGRIPWQQDSSLAYTPQLGGDRPQQAVDTAYINANLWWRADRGGAKFLYIGREAKDGQVLDHLSISPKGGKPFDAWFDTRTHLLFQIKCEQQFFHVTETYLDYRREAGVMLAHKVVYDPGLGDDGIETSVLTKASFGSAKPLSEYALPSVAPSGALIIDGAASTTVPFRLLNNHIYFQAMVDGKGPFTFILDTGGHTLLSPLLVQAVGLKAVGKGVTSGAGDGHGRSGFVHFDEIEIGNLRLRDQIGFATDIYDRSIEGIDVDGMVGFELIRRMVTTIDYGRNTITFTNPKMFKPSSAIGVPVPFVFYDHLPYVAGSVAGLSAHFDIDTGSRSQIDFTSPFVQSHDFRARFPQGVSAVVGWGVGGPSRSFVVRLASLYLGSVKVTDIAAGLSEAKGGAFSDPSFDGNIGSGLLKQFIVTFDYTHQIIVSLRCEPPCLAGVIT